MPLEGLMSTRMDWN